MGMFRNDVLSCVASEDLSIYRLVKITGAASNGLPTVAYADEADSAAVGTTTTTVASGSTIGVKLFLADGTHSIVADVPTTPIAAGDAVYQADDGKVSADTSTTLVGIALEPCTVANTGTEIEVLMLR